MSKPEAISAVTLATHDMARAVSFYEALGFETLEGGRAAGFTTFGLGRTALNLMAVSDDHSWSWWGRVIVYVSDVDDTYGLALARHLTPDFSPRNADWGERYFHITDPDGHEISFATPL